MRNLVTKIKLNWKDGSPVLPEKVFVGIGDLTFEQLSTLRHRGAFSTVSLTFARCCQLTQHRTAHFDSHQSLLEQWYQVCCNLDLCSQLRLILCRVLSNAYLSKHQRQDVRLASLP
jgi:hypothetical protein